MMNPILEMLIRCIIFINKIHSSISAGINDEVEINDNAKDGFVVD